MEDLKTGEIYCVYAPKGKHCVLEKYRQDCTLCSCVALRKAGRDLVDALLGRKERDFFCDHFEEDVWNYGRK